MNYFIMYALVWSVTWYFAARGHIKNQLDWHERVDSDDILTGMFQGFFLGFIWPVALFILTAEKIAEIIAEKINAKEKAKKLEKMGR